MTGIRNDKSAQHETGTAADVHGADAGMRPPHLSPPAAHEIQKAYQDLFSCYSELQRNYRAALSKNKTSSQVIKRQEKEIATLKLRYASRLPSNRSVLRTKKSGGCLKELGEAFPVVETLAADKENVENALGELRLRLSSAEQQLQMLRGDAARNENDITSPMAKHIASSQESSAQKLHLLQAQHELDKSRMQAQEKKLERILQLHNEYKKRYASLKKELNFHRQENEDLQDRIVQLEECRDEVEQLSDQNRLLETKVRRLCQLSASKKGGSCRRERDVLARELKEAQADRESLLEEKRDLLEENAHLNRQLKSAERCLVRQRERGDDPFDEKPTTAPRRISDVWKLLDESQQECIKKNEELEITHAATRKLRSDLGSARSEIDELKMQIRSLEHVNKAKTSEEPQNASPCQRISKNGTESETKSDSPCTSWNSGSRS